MTEKELFLRINEMAMQARAIAMSQAPIKTGRMMRSIQIVNYPDGFGIKVPESIDYFEYTDDLDTLNNPSEKQMANAGWFSERTFNLISNMLAARLQSTSRKIE
jgi:hypothetical protein